MSVTMKENAIFKTRNGRRAWVIKELTMEGRPEFHWLVAVQYSHGDTHYLYNKHGELTGRETGHLLDLCLL